MSLLIDRIEMTFGKQHVLKGISLFAEPGEFLALLGPSGSGKTTLLRIIAGLEFADAGIVRFNDQDLLAKPVRERQIGFVFQHYALFRHMTVFDNVAFGLRSRRNTTRPSEARIGERVRELLALVQLADFGGRYPAQLSGGQRQRVALARALAIEPKILLLDEPFGALDAKVRRELRRWLRALHERTGLTTIFVTHDQEESLELADRVALLRDGAIEQVGTPEELYHDPVSPFVFEFLGDTTRWPCEVEGGIAVIRGIGTPIQGGAPGFNGPATAYVRPDGFALVSGDEPGMPCRITDVMLAGPEARVDVVLEDGLSLELRVPHAIANRLSPRDRVAIAPRSARVWRD